MNGGAGAGLPPRIPRAQFAGASGMALAFGYPNDQPA